jgi:tetratricopeptide (TPR) repeat protein
MEPVRFFGSEKVYDRRKILDAADRARVKGRHKRAVAEYRKVLAVEPQDPVIHGKIAPLLAKTGQLAEAQRSFEVAAETYVAKGFYDRALAIYSQATEVFPRHATFFLNASNLQEQRGRRAEAVATLLRGARKKRANGILLLRRVLEMEPRHIDGTVLLARELARHGERLEAEQRLRDLAPYLTGRGLRKVRLAEFVITKSPSALFRYAKTFL